MTAVIMFGIDGRIDEANEEALALLGVSLAELRELPPGTFSADPPDPAGSAAFREQWERDGRPDIGGQATLHRPNATEIRVRFAISQLAADRFRAILEPVDSPVDQPTAIFTGGQVLAAWRAAERRLATLAPDSPEIRAVESEIEHFRTLYQGLFRR